MKLLCRIFGHKKDAIYQRMNAVEHGMVCVRKNCGAKLHLKKRMGWVGEWKYD